MVDVPGLGQVSEDQMRMAMDFREKLSERMASTIVEASAMGGKVKVA